MTTVLTDIPLDQLHDSPFQPRTVYAGIDGLADSIRADGVQQPLKVRPRRPNPLRDDLVAGYEIVFGHRRKRAADQTDKARSAGRGQIGAADEPERDTRTADLFDTAAA